MAIIRAGQSIWMVVLFACSAGAQAHEDEVLFNRVYLEAQAEREAPNDEMQVLLISEHQGAQPQAIAAAVNKDMEWALALAGKYADVEVKTLGYRTVPVYEKRVITSWQASQEVQLTSRSSAHMTELVGKLQERLQVRGMGFQPAADTRQRHLDELIEEAMVAFKRRVGLVAKQMDGKSFRIVELHVNTSGGRPPIMYAERAMMKTMDAASEPSVEAGTSTLTVSVSGSVQFY